MKRKILTVMILAVAAVLLFPTVSFASEAADELWKDYLDVVPGQDGRESPGDVLSSVGFDALLREITQSVTDGVSPAVSFFALVMGLSALIAMAESASPLELDEKKGAAGATSVIATAALLLQMKGAVEAVKDGLSELTVLLSGLIPVLSGILAAGGSMESAAMQAMNMNITLGIISFLESKLVMPLVSSLFCLSAVSGLDSGGVSKIAKSIKGAFTFVSGIVTAVLSAAISMQSWITRAKDSAYLAAARYAASGMIPMVGGTVSSALSTLGGGLSIVRGAVGAGAIVAIISIALAPLVMLLFYKMSLGIGISLLEGCGGTSGGVRAFSALKGALDALIAVYSMTATVAVFEIVVFMKCGVESFG